VSRILIVDGSPADRNWLQERLEAVGHEVLATDDATAAVARLEQKPFDMLVTDAMLRDMSGLDLAQLLRKHVNGRLTRVLMVSERGDATSLAQALDSGIDDYVTKPVREEELIARVHAALRRPATPSRESVLEIGPVRLDKLCHKVTVRSREIALAPVEFRLMACFMENPGRVLARRLLLEQVWHCAGIGERTVDVHVRRLRAALEPHDCEHLLQTVRGFGYRFG